MPTSAIGSTLRSPSGTAKISTSDLAFVCARNRAHAYSILIREFKKSGLTQSDLAKRLDRAPEVISRFLKRPRNLEMDTYSELLFAISGAVPKIHTAYPLAQSKEVAAEAAIEVGAEKDNTPKTRFLRHRPSSDTNIARVLGEGKSENDFWRSFVSDRNDPKPAARLGERIAA